MKTVRLMTMALLAFCAVHLYAQEDSMPTAVPEILTAIPFHLEQPYIHYWRAEQPKVQSGYILVLGVVPFRAKQTAERVLFVGSQTAERINSGEHSGRIVALVPGNVDDPSHPDYIDLARDLIWFGKPDLPEQVNGAKVTEQRALAIANDFTPFSRDQVDQARSVGGAAVRVTQKVELFGLLADLVNLHSPDEEALIASLRLPRR